MLAQQIVNCSFPDGALSLCLDTTGLMLLGCIKLKEKVAQTVGGSEAENEKSDDLISAKEKNPFFLMIAFIYMTIFTILKSSHKFACFQFSRGSNFTFRNWSLKNIVIISKILFYWPHQREVNVLFFFLPLSIPYSTWLLFKDRIATWLPSYWNKMEFDGKEW